MSEMININEVIRNTRRYWYVDGLSEISGGVLIALIALTYYLSYQVENIATRSLLLGFGQPAVIILGTVLARKVIAYLKEKITYPRTGYLSFKQQKGNKRVRRVLMVIILAVITSVLVTFFLKAFPDRYLPLLTAVLLGVFTLYLGYQNAVPRFFVVSVLTIVWGGFLTWFYPDFVLIFPLLFAGIGIIWIIAGLWTFIRYMQQTEPAEEKNE